ncbi:MAG TPA: Xaa-Pro aminopeptidase, partial [Longimicrobiaceae bacterium]|nr:Xaa-Pro aminopeptidase [Longimicrobiaceae bacterium]
MKLRAGLLSLAALAALLPAAAPCDPGPDPEPRAAPTPIAREEYARRREALAARMPDDGVLVVFGAVEPEVDPHGVVQNPAFRYLAGIVEPGAVLVVARSGGRARSTLFVRPRDPATEVWNGARLGTERATALSGIPAREATQLRPVLDSLLAAGLKTVYTVSPYADDAPDSGALRADQQLVRELVAAHAGAQEASLTGELNRLRGTKSPAELDLLRRAIEITSFAHLDAMRTVEPGMNEFEVQA